MWRYQWNGVAHIPYVTLIMCLHSLLPNETQMFEDMVRLYFNHQKPPGARLVERGDYRLVHAGIGSVVEPSRWTYDVKPGHTVETSMIVHGRNQCWVKCPRCRTQFEGQAKNRWVDWEVYRHGITTSLLMHFAACIVLGGFKLKPDMQTSTAWSHQ
jgi:hypothetical protein